jgi:hypothetical protein
VSWLRWLQRGAFRRSSYLQTRRERAASFFLQSNALVCVSLLVFGVVVAVFANPSAQATIIGRSLSFYIDAPFVENSYVYTDHPADGTSLTTFDSQSANNQACRVNDATVTLLDQPYGCVTQNDRNWGGAITASSEPTVGNVTDGNQIVPNRYAQANGSRGVRLEFSTPQTYFGLWWSAGSDGNIITFYRSGQIIGSTSADDVSNRIDQQTTYTKSRYRGNPATWSLQGGSYSHIGTFWQNENFVYLHYFMEPGVTFDRVELSAPGNGFEFDNLVTSNRTDLAPSARLIKVKDVQSRPGRVTYDPNNGGIGWTPPDQLSWDAALPIDQCTPDYSHCMSAPGNTSGWQFDGWNTNADGSGSRYAPAHPWWWVPDPGIKYPFNEDAILYAQWITYLSVSPDPTWKWQTDNPDTYSGWTNPVSPTLHSTDSYTLPSPSDFSDFPTIPGWHFTGWVYEYDDGTGTLVDVPLGGPGATMIPDQITSMLQVNFYGQINGAWEADSGPSSPAPTATVPDSFPVDPRATSVKLPEMPISGASVANVCVSEVDSAHDPVGGSDLTQSAPAPSPSGPNLTSAVTVNSGTALGRTPNRYLLYKVAATDDAGCTSGNSYYIRLYPLQLGDKRSADADLSKH